MDDKVRESLLHANSPEEVLQIIDNADDEATKEEEKEAQEQEAAAGWCDKWFCKYDRC